MEALGEELKDLERAGADMVHLDVMDGVFVPNLTFGPSMVRALRELSDLVFDTHLMIVDPARYVQEYIDAGSGRISFHLESQSPVHDLLEYIRRAGIKAGLAINPEPPLERLIPYLGKLDFVLVMTVHPGFYGQKLIVEALDKVRKLRHIIGTEGLEVTIEVDGGVALSNIEMVAQAGANEVVAGSAVMKAPDRAKAISDLRLVSGA